MSYILHKSSEVGALFLIACLMISCSNKQKSTVFQKIGASHSGIDFINSITETEDFNILNFHYIYNGGGVGVGDFDKNGLPDLFFSGNQVASKLYLNKGNLKFADVSDEAGILSDGWSTGVSVVDINADGWLDIYVSVGGYQCDSTCFNKLYINRGLDENQVPVFKEMASSYGLEDGLYTQQAVFFDFDDDGDLDVYLLHNVIDNRDKNIPSDKHFINQKSKDVLLRNQGNGKFEDVSESMGIYHRGYGLGVTINDFNNDQLPDIYIANDFLSDDRLYINKGIINEQHQGFKDMSTTLLKHTSYNAMGVDVADINNDALPDIFVLDMLPAYNERQKTMLGFMNYNKFQLSLRQGYSPQFVRNTLQLHSGFLNEELIPFSEIGYLSGVYNTDWSWTPLLADFDNDGDRDLFVTNGYGKDITDLDFINYSQQRSPFGTPKSQHKELFEKIQNMAPITMPNFIFENMDGLTFKDQSGTWIPKENSISNGAVYVDLDMDGDLDIVTNNIDQRAYILENNTPSRNYLKINLKGKDANLGAIGATVMVWSGGDQQVYYHSPVRGYLSTVDHIIHFGIRDNKIVDSLKVLWSDREETTLKDISANQLLDISYSKTKNISIPSVKKSKTLFTQIDLFDFVHQENPWQDFDAQPLLLHQHSRQGPCLVAANIDGKPGEELYVGGAKGFPGRIYYDISEERYKSQGLDDSNAEDTAAAFFDFDQDGDLDLYVVSGGVEFKAGTAAMQDRLYLNDGAGVFSRHNISLPVSSGSCVLPCDFDQDGDIDLFVGARVEPQQYPRSPKSSLLINQGGQFIDATEKLYNSNGILGMVTDAVWSDVDGNSWSDLVIVGEWMPITIFKNYSGTFTKTVIKHSSGLWNTIAKTDFDQDGDDDFIIGNLGNNTRLKASIKEPLLIYKDDFDGNGSIDPFIGQFYLGKDGERKSYPLHARDDIVKQVVSIKNRFITYADFGQATFPDMMGKDINSDNFLRAEFLQSVYLINQGNDDYKLIPLPYQAQLAPIQNIAIGDFDKDNIADVLLSGNNYTGEKNNGWQDAFNGLFLKGDGRDFEVMSTAQSGFCLPFDGRDVVKLSTIKGIELIVAGQNLKPMATFIINKD